MFPFFFYSSLKIIETSPEAQWLRLHMSNAGVVGSIPSQGTKILHEAQHGHPKKIIQNLGVKERK